MNTRTNLTVILPTTGRPTLANTLKSLSQLGAGDELVLIVDGGPSAALQVLSEARLACPIKTILHSPPSGDWVESLRDTYSRRAAGDYLLHVNDDDAYVPGAISLVREHIRRNPGKMLVFSVAARERPVPWPGQIGIWYGNISTSCVALPNDPSRWGTWGGREPGGDFRFYSSCRFERAWVDSTIAVIRPHLWPSPADTYVTRPPADVAEHDHTIEQTSSAFNQLGSIEP
jgi:hypothetical protein